jgi:DNA-binding transcriptional ArsR family regulator
MEKQEKQRSEARAKILKALAHPSRIFMVEKLYKKSFCVCELSEMIGIDMSTASKHLSILKNAGIVEDNKQGTTVYYSLRCACIMEFIGCIETVIRQNFENGFAYLNKEKPHA